jgi:RNA polymerase sigma-70 factor (ECF subfamily)
MTPDPDRRSPEERFRTVFSHYGAVLAYARRRGSRDADAIAAEVMTIAWRRLADVPRDDPRPWLYATARNLVLAEARRSARSEVAFFFSEEVAAPPEAVEADDERRLERSHDLPTRRERRRGSQKGSILCCLHWL